jgi:hypothetical protein
VLTIVNDVLTSAVSGLEDEEEAAVLSGEGEEDAEEQAESKEAQRMLHRIVLIVFFICISLFGYVHYILNCMDQGPES